MNNKKQKATQVKKGQIYELKNNVKINFYTKGKRYEVEAVEYDNGRGQDIITLIDDDWHKHPISENIFLAFFKLCKIQ